MKDDGKGMVKIDPKEEQEEESDVKVMNNEQVMKISNNNENSEKVVKVVNDKKNGEKIMKVMNDEKKVKMKVVKRCTRLHVGMQGP